MAKHSKRGLETDGVNASASGEAGRSKPIKPFSAATAEGPVHEKRIMHNRCYEQRAGIGMTSA
ncbi:hypothetical protein CERZMDRAFT_90405 [Cercospora zeae-maydis SCOH1-5]|uniref:Uncharacterized protein n=1 Tax=Cercospora zeae-maydis SCOH1-5 TaxID=717836 RepID=A0A6A6FKR6_9PEZI|nr:hypothetical protein CERZMDRAFT_90405 [Cercospora zeae-maydis SCOH1-5]